MRLQQRQFQSNLKKGPLLVLRPQHESNESKLMEALKVKSTTQTHTRLNSRHKWFPLLFSLGQSVGRTTPSPRQERIWQSTQKEKSNVTVMQDVLRWTVWRDSKFDGMKRNDIHSWRFAPGKARAGAPIEGGSKGDWPSSERKCSTENESDIGFGWNKATSRICGTRRANICGQASGVTEKSPTFGTVPPIENERADNLAVSAATRASRYVKDLEKLTKR